MSNENLTKIVNALDTLAPFLKDFFEENVVFEVVDLEKCVKFVSNEDIPLHVKEGDYISKQSVDYQCQSSNKTVSKTVPKELYGIPLKVIASSIKDEKGKVLGSISIGKDLNRQVNINDLAASLSNSLNSINISTKKLVLDINSLVTANQTILENISNAQKEAEETNEVIDFVRNISGQTNLLGLNAAIEAARAGEQGRGFNIVAQQIRKLSTSSNESIQKINTVLKSIQNTILEISQGADDANVVLENQSKAIKEMNDALEQISQTAKSLEDLAARS